MRKTGRAAVAAALCAAALHPAAAMAIPLSSGETLRVHFSFTAPPQSTQAPPGHPSNIADTLFGLLDVVRLSGIGAPSATFSLYDGAALLGSFSLAFSSPFTAFAFSGPGSPFSFQAGDASDFSPLDDGTIDGVLDITSTSSAIYDFSVRRLEAGHGTGSNSYHPLRPQATILSQALRLEEVAAAPEPGGLLLFAGGLAGLAAARTKRRLTGLNRSRRPGESCAPP